MIIIDIVIFADWSKVMNVEYLPLTRLVKAVKDGLPLINLRNIFCTIFGASSK